MLKSAGFSQKKVQKQEKKKSPLNFPPVLKCLVLSDKQSRTQRFSLGMYDKEKHKNEEAGTS